MLAPTLLLVDPDRYINSTMSQQLEQAGFVLNVTHSALGAFELAARCEPTLVLLDARLPDMAAGSFVANMLRQYPHSLVLVMVDASQGLEAGEAMRHGAIDYLHKPFDGGQLLVALQHAMRLHQTIPDLVAVSHASRQVLQLARRAAQTNASILIGGESGTGKERLARFIHDVSPRAGKPFIAINCAAIPESMLEATLFGHARGAFTGAVASQEGKFELANGGTLLLDEIGELPLALQAKLLRVLQEREVERIGSHQKIALDVRIIAASNHDLRELVAQGRFRQDLFYRLDVLPLAWPSLRDRRDDILPLAEHFIRKYSCSGNHLLSPAARQALLAYAWPGNVRELENVIQRALILTRGLHLQPIDLLLPHAASSAEWVAPRAEGGSVPSAGCLAASKRQAEFQVVLETLRRFEGHRTRTAEALGLTTRALRYKLAAMRDQGIDIEQLVRI
ncbi:MAG: sigma-54-dependent transcriptional regulator [Aeromonadaceae bacterium]